MSVSGKLRDASQNAGASNWFDWDVNARFQADISLTHSRVLRRGVREREDSSHALYGHGPLRITQSWGNSIAQVSRGRDTNSLDERVLEVERVSEPTQRSSCSPGEPFSTCGTTALMTRGAYLQELAHSINRYTSAIRGTSQFATPVDGLSVVRSESCTQPVRRASGLAICMTVQGAEWEMVGTKRFDYGPGQAFIFSVEERSRCTAPLASPQTPYLGLVIEIDRASAQQMIEELGLSNKSDVHRKHGPLPLDLGPQLLDCVLRSLRLLETPEAIPMLYPGIMREMCYWLLTGPASSQIIDNTRATAHDKRVLQAIQHLRGNFSDQIRVEELAHAAGMSPATFHRQFKSVTSVSPLQYQKQLRLLEARRLMIVNASNVESVAFEVGYVSASQFSREYTRMFGKSPRRDMSGGVTSKAPLGYAPPRSVAGRA